MERVAVFAGTFDPFTRGHEDIARRALRLFDRVILAIGRHAGKQTLFPLESRMRIIQDVFANEPRVTVDFYDGLTIDFCKAVGAGYLIRGLRSGTDFDYERTIAQANSMVNPDVETLFFVTRQEHAPITSTVVRDILIHGGDTRPFLSEKIDLARYPWNKPVAQTDSEQ